ncbi:MULTISPECIES: hypothetical protein [Phyllobacteriaceae]|uniref:hypothetical protein n=1 Tax=Phyllobacteriaceae TaxID=69277 RepID=UPI0011128CD2|nr:MULTISPECIES: hypothetical protein [Mesorhizobium]MBN9234325.1 hypothetical protein [Mesorhizobium sp.]MDQ0332391.1 hypothetical protein [Mesorhizobium sp. YL-MeA3-2017]
MSASPKLPRIANVIQWAMIGVLGLFLTAAIGGAVLVLIGAMGGWPELKALGGYAAGIGAVGFFLGLFVMPPFFRFVSELSRVTDRDRAR